MRAGVGTFCKTVKTTRQHIVLVVFREPILAALQAALPCEK